MKIHIEIIGGLLVILAFAHLVFPKYFNWKEDLKKLSLINRQMMQIHTLFIALFVFLMGALCITSSDELQSTELGQKVALGLSIFWSIRLVIQFIGYSSKLWKGKRFETIVHVAFACLWFYMSVVFALVYLQSI